MSVYPEGHKPFIPRGCLMDPYTEKTIRKIAQGSFEKALWYAAETFWISRLNLEQLRVALFRAEQLIETEPLPAPCDITEGILLQDLAHGIDAILETLAATRKCLEEWRESQTFMAMLEQYPHVT